MCNKTLSSNKRHLRYNNNFLIIDKLIGFPYPHRIRVNTTCVTIIQANISFEFCGYRWHSLQSRLKLPQMWLHERKSSEKSIAVEAQKNSSATETWIKILTSWCGIKPCPYLACVAGVKGGGGRGGGREFGRKKTEGEEGRERLYKSRFFCISAYCFTAIGLTELSVYDQSEWGTRSSAWLNNAGRREKIFIAQRALWENLQAV